MSKRVGRVRQYNGTSMNRIAEALKHTDGSHTLADIKAGVQSGAYQHWLGEHSVIITEIVATPQYKILRFFLAGGDLQEIEQMAQGIMFWGLRQGCVKAELIGRFGWQRTKAASRQGWKPVGVVMEVRL